MQAWTFCHTSLTRAESSYLWARMPPTPHPPDTAAHRAKRGYFPLSSGGRCSLCQRHRNSGMA